MEHVIVIGSGPAGLTAALYAARANLNPLLLTGNELGGQIATTTDVENFPGFPDGATGPELYDLMSRQAEKFGTRIEVDHVTKVNLKERPFRLQTQNGQSHDTQVLIIATGASPRKLGVPGEAEFLGRGVSYCATCDGFFFRDKKLAVVGGGDSALQEGLFLTKFATQVEVIHRRGQLRAGPALAKRAEKNEKMGFVWDTVVDEVIGNGKVEALKVRNTKTNEESTMDADGVFIYIGHIPNTDLFKGQLKMDEEGYLIVNERLHTEIPGVFAAGEVHDHTFRQAIVSSGYGCMAAMEAQKYLDELEG